MQQNIYRLEFPARFSHVDFSCPDGYDCHNATHWKLYNLKTNKEVKPSEFRIDAMRELWHGK